MDRRVVVTGLGCVTPIGNTIEEFWASILEGRSGTGPVTRFDAEKFSSKVDAEVKNFNPEDYIDSKEARKLDPFVHYALASATQAVSDSGLMDSSPDWDRVGVSIGSGIGGIQTIEQQKEVLDARGPRRISPFLIPMLLINMASGHVSMKYGLRGPNTSVVTACATSTHSIGESMRLIQHGQADVMVTGGTEAAITPLGFGGFCSMKALSTRNDRPETASSPFDKERDGFVMGEGAGVLVLEELEHAKKRGARILAEIVGYGMTADAYHITSPVPEGVGAQKAMRLAADDAQVALGDVEYINAHGTSTHFNDKTEAFAIHALFGEHAKELAVSSTKALTGHMLGAAGAAEAIVCVKMMQDNVVAPTYHYETPDEECMGLDFVPNEVREKKIDVAMSNSFGFGGHNAVLVFRRFA
ncbi:beta-ketoacyl-ACP synthase II [bacterium]|nr:beta-ketoacyl-ACP synthase II [bacterium]